MDKFLPADLNRNTNLNSLLNSNHQGSSETHSSKLGSQIKNISQTPMMASTGRPLTAVSSSQSPPAELFTELTAASFAESSAINSQEIYSGVVEKELIHFENIVKANSFKKRNVAAFKKMKSQADKLLEAICIATEKKVSLLEMLSTDVNNVNFNQPLEGLALKLFNHDKAYLITKKLLFILLTQANIYQPVIKAIQNLKRFEEIMVQLDQNQIFKKLFPNEPLKIHYLKKFITFSLFMATATIIEDLTKIYIEFQKVHCPNNQKIIDNFISISNLCNDLMVCIPLADIAKKSNVFNEFVKKHRKETSIVSNEDMLLKTVADLGEKAQTFFDWFDLAQMHSLSKEEFIFLQPLVQQFSDLTKTLPDVFEKLAGKAMLNLYYPKKLSLPKT